MRWTGQIFWLLAYRTQLSTTLLPAFTARHLPSDWPLGSCIQLQQRNCSRFTRDFLRRSTNQARKELRSEIATCVYLFKDFLARLSSRSAPQAATKLKSEGVDRSEEHTSELQSPCNLVC